MMADASRRPLLALFAVVALTLPWVGVWWLDIAPGLSSPAVILVSGVAVIGAAFLLTWAAETAEKDVPRSFALAVLSVIAVAPEYAVDALFAWEAGQAPGTPADGSVALLGLFGVQFVPQYQQYEGLLAFSGLYVALGVGVLVVRRHKVEAVVREAYRQVRSEEKQVSGGTECDNGGGSP